MIHVSAHAVSRYRSRVALVSETEAADALRSTAVERAADFGAPYVKLGTGQRIVLEGRNVVTVLPTGTWPASLDRRRRNPISPAAKDRS